MAMKGRPGMAKPALKISSSVTTTVQVMLFDWMKIGSSCTSFAGLPRQSMGFDAKFSIRPCRLVTPTTSTSQPR